MEDFEAKNRFYHKRDLDNDVRPHKYAYRVWFQSMSLRYNIEMLFFAIAVFVFQFFISGFNTDMHLLDTDIHHLEYYHIIEILPDGHIVTLEELVNRNRQISDRQLAEAWEAEDHGSCLRELRFVFTPDRVLDENDAAGADNTGTGDGADNIGTADGTAEDPAVNDCRARYMGDKGREDKRLMAGGLGEVESKTFNYCYCLGIFTEEELIDI